MWSSDSIMSANHVCHIHSVIFGASLFQPQVQLATGSVAKVPCLPKTRVGPVNEYFEGGGIPHLILNKGSVCLLCVCVCSCVFATGFGVLLVYI